MKVFGIGLERTGTTSLAMYSVFDNQRWNKNTRSTLNNRMFVEA